MAEAGEPSAVRVPGGAGSVSIESIRGMESERVAPRVPMPGRMATRDSVDITQGLPEEPEGFPTPENWRQSLHLLLEEPDSSWYAEKMSQAILITIMVAVGSFVFSTVPSVMDSKVWPVMEVLTTAVFTLEYGFRLLVCDAFGNVSKLEFVKDRMNILDLLSVLPFYVELALQSLDSVKAFRALRSIRLVRCFRLFRLSKYSVGMNLMVESVAHSLQPLSILSFFLFIGVVLFSSLMYYAERASCPDVKAMLAAGTFDGYREECWRLGDGFSKSGELCCNQYGAADDFTSIVDAFWWAIVTMTTVGYGDRYPRTPAGKLVGGLTMLSGIVLISLPIAVVGSQFQQAYEAEEFENVATSLLTNQAIGKGIPLACLNPAVRRRSKERLTRMLRVNPRLADSELVKDLLKETAAEAGTATVQTITSGISSPVQSAAPGNQVGPKALRRRLPDLSAKLKRLFMSEKMNGNAREEIQLLLELFDHLDRVEIKLHKMREKEVTLDANIRHELAAVARQCDQKVQQQGTGVGGDTSGASPPRSRAASDGSAH